MTITQNLLTAAESWWCIKLRDITSLGSVQVVGFFDVAARLCTGDGPIPVLVGVLAPLDRSCTATNASKVLFRDPFCLSTHK